MRSALRFPKFEGYHEVETTQSTWTKAIQLREPAAATRLVIVAIMTHGGAHTDTSLSVFGTALTQNVTHASGAFGLSLYSGYVTTGQDGNVVAVVSVALARWGMAIFSLPRASATPAATYTDDAGALNAALALTAGSFAVVGVSCANGEGARPCWSGIKPIFSHRVGTVTAHFSVAALHSRIAETRNVQAQWDNGSSNVRLVGGVWA